MIMTQEEVDAMLHPKLRDTRMPLLFETVTNEDDGIEALIMDGNEQYSYRVVYRDTDAEEAIGVVFCDTYLDAKRHADNFASKK